MIPSRPWPPAIRCDSCVVRLATATTNVRSNSNSSWLEARCGSSIGRATIRVRIGARPSSVGGGAAVSRSISQDCGRVRCSNVGPAVSTPSSTGIFISLSACPFRPNITLTALPSSLGLPSNAASRTPSSSL